jgi:peptidoglycan hydrolase-like protein with peptidoglycan-binding domain
MSDLQVSKPKSCPVLKQGSKGDWVVCLQNALNHLGYGPLTSDGNFGPKTTDVIKKFQKNLGLQADGIVGEKTWLAIDKQATAQGWEPSWPTTQKTDTDTSVGQLNQAILKAALNLRGMSTAHGPGGGNQACAWMLNRVLEKAGIPTLGENPNLVTSLVEALQGGRGQLVSKAEALAGDLVIAYGEDHIGVGLDDGCKRVLSNSSSRASFRWESNTDFDGYYGGSSTIYRLIN